MAKSLFHKDTPKDTPPTPLEKIESEISHLKKGTSVRHGNRRPSSAAPWLIVLALMGVGWLYVMDPVIHAWDKGEAARVYLYLHSYGTGPTIDNLIATQIIAPEEVQVLNGRPGSFENYFVSPGAATTKAEAIIKYMDSVKALQSGKYEQLDPVNKLRYYLFIRNDIFLPTQWSFLDPAISG
jgi:hypothetical protein